MRYFAEIKDGAVTRVIVADTKEWCETRLGGEWKETFMDGSKNYAGKNHIYVENKTNFAWPKPYASWTLDTNCKWEAPVKQPDMSLGTNYIWDEKSTSWKEVL